MVKKHSDSEKGILQDTTYTSHGALAEMKDRSDDISYHERTHLSQSYILLQTLIANNHTNHVKMKSINGIIDIDYFSAHSHHCCYIYKI